LRKDYQPINDVCRDGKGYCCGYLLLRLTTNGCLGYLPIPAQASAASITKLFAVRHHQHSFDVRIYRRQATASANDFLPPSGKAAAAPKSAAPACQTM
jgi:hypothetical protein